VLKILASSSDLGVRVELEGEPPMLDWLLLWEEALTDFAKDLCCMMMK
jgi:hypothetical protein